MSKLTDQLRSSLENNSGPSSPALAEEDSIGIEVMSQAYATTISRYATPGLLDTPPPTEGIPKDKALLTLITDRSLYQALLGMLCSGTSIKAAFGTVGIMHRQITQWLSQGAQEAAQDRDTYLARLTMDVYRCKSTAKADAEMKVKSANPHHWLRNESTGRDWDDRPDAIPLLRPEDHLEAANQEQQEDYQAIDNNTILEVFQALNKAKALPSNEVVRKEVERGAG